MTETVDVHGLSGAYVLNAVSDIERAAFARHLRGCETCALEVAELTETTARLADETWSVPPPRLRADVLGRIRQTRQLPPGPPPKAERTATSRWRRRTALAAAAAVVVAGAGAGAYLVQESRVRDQRAVADAARAETARIEAVVTAPDAVLRGAAGPGGGRVTVVASPSRDAAVAVLDDLPALGPDEVYQLWLIEDAGATSMGALDVGVTDTRRLINGVRGASAFGVSVEPPGGSPTPSGNPLVIPL